MEARLLLVLAAAGATTVAPALRGAFPAALVIQSDEPGVAIEAPGEFHVVIIHAITNEGFARVRRIRASDRDLPIVVISDRDRSGAAYVAGANEFVLEYDHDQLINVVRDALAPIRDDAPAPAGGAACG